ncbi:YopX family protein [Lysinibacillus capsici]|uniref:YopX family protein n=1 Tax=Lysinibacillus capsici TaxID=2115968 RepID=UPI002898F47B|nr:YopX family protein [Lysinibacillus capsici]
MSREIKFRGWHKGLNKWVYGFLTRNKNGVYYIENADSVYGIAEEKSVGQYTGLKDKHGTEIFDGDILAINNTRYVVGYREYSGGWQLEIKNEYCAEMVQGNCELLEVIGNIYEHKHLLEATT